MDTYRENAQKFLDDTKTGVEITTLSKTAGRREYTQKSFVRLKAKDKSFGFEWQSTYILSEEEKTTLMNRCEASANFFSDANIAIDAVLWLSHAANPSLPNQVSDEFLEAMVQRLNYVISTVEDFRALEKMAAELMEISNGLKFLYNEEQLKQLNAVM